METNHKKGHNRKGYHLKKHKKQDKRKGFDPRPTNKEVDEEKPVLFQLGSIASYVVSDVPLTADPKITTSKSASLALSSPSPTSSGDDLHKLNAKERKKSLSFDSSQHNKELLSLSSRLSDTPGSQVSGVTHASVDPALLSPSVQMMDREGSDNTRRNSLPILEKSFSTVSNESLFSLSIGENTIKRDELFSYRDFKAGELLKSGELLSFCPSIPISIGSFDQGKSFDLEGKQSGETEVRTLRTDSEDKSSNSNVSWRNLGDCTNSDETSSSTQSFSYPITKKNKKKKKKKKGKKKKKTTQQQQQKQKKRCSCFSCCRWPSCDYKFSCCKRIKCCSCCCSSCGWLFCCHWSCCCSSSSKKGVDDETSKGSDEQRLQKTSHKWLCCFPSC